MRIDNVDYPDLLVDAIREDRLVVFAGAGVSMGAPTNLPSFNELSEKISQLTHEYKLENEPEEQYLGRVKNLGYDVHKEVCKILNEANLKPNEYHNILINLFKSDDVRVITTNYDLMFEKTLNQYQHNFRTYSYPALPYGNDFKGIVHLHGEVCDPSNIVLTDSDFGKSYMYYGNVTSFLRTLFESDYVVLFVGYSYSDIVMKYFTRALPDLSGQKRFIFACDDQVDDYKSLGLTPIIYDKDDYSQLYNSLSKLSKLVIRDDNNWNLRIMDIAEEVPNKMSDEFNYEVKEILSNIHYTIKLFGLVRSKNWAEYLFNMGYFDEIFTNNKLSNFGHQKIKWISDTIIKNELDLFIKFCYEKDFILNQALQNEIALCICSLKNDVDKISILINLIDLKEISFYYLKDLLDLCFEHSPRFDLLASRIISAALEFEPKKDTFISQDRLKIKFKFSEFEISTLWEKYSQFDNKYYIDILNSISNQLNSLYRFTQIGLPVDNFTFSSFYPEEKEFLNEHDSLMHIFAKLLNGLDESEKDYWFRTYINSNISLLVRSSLLVLKEIQDISGREKLNILKNMNFKIFDISLKEELFILYGRIFPSLEDDDKKDFLGNLMSEEKLNEKYTDESYFYQKYNLLVWLNRFDPNNADIEKYKNEILDKYSYFKPRDYPQKSIGPITTKWGDGPLPYSKSEIIRNLEELFDELLSYSGDGFKSAERYTLIRVLEEICVENNEFRNRLINLLINNSQLENDIWKSVVNSLGKSDNTEIEFIEILEKIFIQPVISLYCYEFSSVIYSNIKNRESISEDLIDFLFKKIKFLWPVSSNFEYETTDYMSKALNSSKGNLAFSMIYLIDASGKNYETKKIESRFKSVLEEMINEDGYNDSFVVILGNASFFYSRDKDWCYKNILSKYDSTDIKLQNIVWNGFVNQSYLYPEFALVMEARFHKALKNIDIFEDANLKKSLLKRYVSLMVNVATNPLEDYIPNIFTREMSNEIIETFYFELSRYIESLENLGRNEMFYKWIFSFLDNRTRNFPVKIDDYEKNKILEFLLHFPEKVDSLGEIFSRFDSSFIIDQNTLFKFIYDLEIDHINSKSITKILEIITSQMKRSVKDEIPNYILIGLKGVFEKVSANEVDTKTLRENLELINALD